MNERTQQKKMALLVIDVQKGLFEKSTPIYKSEQVLENINTLINKARQESVPVIFIQHSNHKTLEKGSDAWQLHPDLQPLAEDVIIHKLHGNAFEGTNLREELEKRNVSILVTTGLVTQGCVKATCWGAIDEGYNVVLVSDGHSSYSKDAAQHREHPTPAQSPGLRFFLLPILVHAPPTVGQMTKNSSNQGKTSKKYDD